MKPASCERDRLDLEIMRIPITEIDAVLDWQSLGMRARRAGIPEESNPLLLNKPAEGASCFEQWRMKFEAWVFGWTIEDAFRLET